MLVNAAIARRNDCRSTPKRQNGVRQENVIFDRTLTVPTPASAWGQPTPGRGRGRVGNGARIVPRTVTPEAGNVRMTKRSRL
jgi:hypothetical protein